MYFCSMYFSLFFCTSSLVFEHIWCTIIEFFHLYKMTLVYSRIPNLCTLSPLLSPLFLPPFLSPFLPPFLPSFFSLSLPSSLFPTLSSSLSFSPLLPLEIYNLSLFLSLALEQHQYFYWSLSRMASGEKPSCCHSFVWSIVCGCGRIGLLL